jgi:hypothetical protein
MADTIRQDEEMPEDYPDVPSGLSAAAQALDLDLVWQRIENYIACRWTARDVTWIVEGPGAWLPPLKPATIATVEIWQSDAWQTVTLTPSALGGYDLPGHGPYRFTGSVGGGDVPAGVTEAFRRLAEYMAGKPGKAGARSERIGAGSISLSHTRSPSWMAEAIQNSGAGDLLRPYRRA